MIRSKDLQKLRIEIENFKRQLKTVEKDLKRAWDIARTDRMTESIFHTLEQKERHFRSMKRRLSEMENNLKVLQEGSKEPVKVAAWKIRRPSAETRLIQFCEV